MQSRSEINAYKRGWYAKNKADQTAKERKRYDGRRTIARESRNTYNAKQREEGGKIHASRVWLDSLKDEPCVDCGNKFPPCAMDWDHVRGEKKFSLDRMRGRFLTEKAKQRVLEEIAKCELVCACCHRVRTEERRQKAS